MELPANLLRTKRSLRTASVLGTATIAVLFAFGLTLGFQKANASGGPSVLGCTDSSNTNVNGSSSVALGTTINCHTWSKNPNANAVHFWVQDPNGGKPIDTGIIPYTTNTVLKYTFTTSTSGDWSVHTTYYQGSEEQRICLCNMHVSFFVLPESSLGAIGLVGSSMAALGLFVRYNKSKNKEATEPSD